MRERRVVPSFVASLRASASKGPAISTVVFIWVTISSDMASRNAGPSALPDVHVDLDVDVDVDGDGDVAVAVGGSSNNRRASRDDACPGNPDPSGP